MDNLQAIEGTDIEPYYIETEYLVNYRFNEFEIRDENTVLKPIKKSTTKSCELDLVPTILLKQYVEVLVPCVHCIITTSLSHGCFTDNLKEAILRALLKKSNMDLTFKNYCPVSNLAYFSKLIEKAVCNQITSFAAQTNNTEELQSAHLEDHSTETTLLKVKTDLLAALDNQEVSCLILLDLSAAFDTVNHKLLLNCLKYCFSFGRKILKWIEDYLSDHIQQIKLMIVCPNQLS